MGAARACMASCSIVPEKAVLVHILYSHKKTRILNIFCTGYEYFKDSSVLYSDFMCFNMTVAL